MQPSEAVAFEVRIEEGGTREFSSCWQQAGVQGAPGVRGRRSIQLTRAGGREDRLTCKAAHSPKSLLHLSPGVFVWPYTHQVCAGPLPLGLACSTSTQYTALLLLNVMPIDRQAQAKAHTQTRKDALPICEHFTHRPSMPAHPTPLLRVRAAVLHCRCAPEKAAAANAQPAHKRSHVEAIRRAGQGKHVFVWWCLWW